MKLFLKILEPITLFAVIVVLVLFAAYGVQNSALLSSIVALSSFVPFIVRFEIQKPRPAEIMPIAVLSAIAVVGRIAMNPLPNFQPVSAIVIFTGIFFGRQSGYLTGAFSALISNMVIGQGAWTPWQMYTWGMMGYFAGLLSEKGLFGNIGKKTKNANNGEVKIRVTLILFYGALTSALFSIVLDTWYLIAFVSNVNIATATTLYTAGIIMNTPHIISTVLFLIIMVKPWGKKIERIKIKYGIGSA